MPTYPTETETENPVYGIDPELRQMVIDTVRSLKKKLLSKESILSFDRDEVFPEETIRQMLGPDIGLQLIFIPEAYGGMGGGARDCCEVTREMARICLGVGTAFFAIQLGADPIIVGGTEAQKEKWLGTIAEGTSLVAYAVTEAGAGSNLAALKTKAEPVSDDDGRITRHPRGLLFLSWKKAPRGLTRGRVKKNMVFVPRIRLLYPLRTCWCRWKTWWGAFLAKD